MHLQDLRLPVIPSGLQSSPRRICFFPRLRRVASNAHSSRALTLSPRAGDKGGAPIGLIPIAETLDHPSAPELFHLPGRYFALDDIWAFPGLCHQTLTTLFPA